MLSGRFDSGANGGVQVVLVEGRFRLGFPLDSAESYRFEDLSRLRISPTSCLTGWREPPAPCDRI